MSNRVAAEALSSGFCPFKCKYCYIPKTPEMRKLHDRVVQSLESGKYIDTLERIFGKDLQSLGLWGTEPVLTLPLVQKDLQILVEKFPKLKDISFSTSMMYKPEVIVSFIRAAADLNRSLLLKIQISLDGPDYITDTNRMRGAAKKIPKNFLKVVRSLQTMKLGSLKVEFKWKPTLSIENIQLFVRSPKKIDEFYEYFETLNKKFDRANKNKNVMLVHQSFKPTLVVPGKYTSEDGRVFGKFIKLLRTKKYTTSYYFRLKRIFNFERELVKRHVFSCSGGDSNFGVEEQALHICHRTFYYDDKEYLESVFATEIDNWDVSNFKRGTLQYLRDRFIVDPTDNAETTRFYYVLRGYHDFWKLQLSYVANMIQELARIGQASKVYLNDDLALMFSLFINVGTSCPMENLLNTSVVHFQVLSLLRIFGNGAFEEILKGVLHGLPKRK